MPNDIGQRDEFGPDLFLQLTYLLGQRPGPFSILLVIGLPKLPPEIDNLAIGPGLRFVIGDGANNVSCVRF